MEKLDKVSVGWNGVVPTFTRLVEEWRPPLLKGETKYRDHLLEVLRKAIPADSKVEKEYRHRGTTVDLWLRWQGVFTSEEVSFELKVNLLRKTDYDRLVGQLEGMEPAKSKIIIVLIGRTDPSLLGRLKERYSQQLGIDLILQTMSIVCVPVEV